MKLTRLLSSSLVTLVLGVGGAVAAPLSNPLAALDLPSLAETAQGHRYHRACSWRHGGWYWIDKHGYRHACRPHHPGHGWRWHHDGHRHGWYHPHKRTWHHKHW